MAFGDVLGFTSAMFVTGQLHAACASEPERPPSLSPGQQLQQPGKVTLWSGARPDNAELS